MSAGKIARHTVHLSMFTTLLAAFMKKRLQTDRSQGFMGCCTVGNATPWPMSFWLPLADIQTPRTPSLTMNGYSTERLTQ